MVRHRILFIVSLSVYGFLFFFITREQFNLLMAAMLALFVCYFVVCRNHSKISWKEILFASIAFRLVALFATPELSDDFFRFIWDGRIMAAFENPFLIHPTDAKDSALIKQLGLGNEVYNRLNSKEYFTVYPPVTQAVFAIAAFIGQQHIWLEVLVMKLILLAAEIGTMLCLRRLLVFFGKNANLVLFYSLNPLVIAEGVGNLHFEVLMIFFLSWSLWLWTQNKLVSTALVFSLAVCIKLIPLLFIPFFIRRIGWKQFFFFCAIVASVTLILFLPFLSKQMLFNLQSSLALYTDKFEFNASIYYILREVGEAIYNYNPIEKWGIWIKVFTALFILYIALFRKNIEFFSALMWAVSIYLFMATTVHPWYILPVVALSIFTRFTFPVLWSLAAVLSYSHYVTGHENYLLITLEYAIVFIAIFMEIKPGRMSALLHGSNA